MKTLAESTLWFFVACCFAVTMLAVVSESLRWLRDWRDERAARKDKQARLAAISRLAVVTPRPDQDVMDDLMLELFAGSRVPVQRRPGGGS